MRIQVIISGLRPTQDDNQSVIDSYKRNYYTESINTLGPVQCHTSILVYIKVSTRNLSDGQDKSSLQGSRQPLQSYHK